jgi:hypothetical protein
MIRGRLGLGPGSSVIEVAANDGYLLKNFVAAGIPLPWHRTHGEHGCGGRGAANAGAARTLFGKISGNGWRAATAAGRRPDPWQQRLCSRVPDIDELHPRACGCPRPGGTITLEFPHLLQLIDQAQFDTVYARTFFPTCRCTPSPASSLLPGLRVFDVEELPTHGGQPACLPAVAAAMTCAPTAAMSPRC